MAFANHRTRFKGELAGITVQELNDLDYSKNNLKERLQFIREKYSKVKDFYNSYIFCKEKNIDLNKEESLYEQQELEQYYKYNLNTTDELSKDINVFKACERDATYLLNSRDIPLEKGMKYNFLNEEEFEALLEKEKTVSLDANTDTLEVLAPIKKNYHTNIDYKITKEDLVHKDAGQVLRDYDQLKDYLKNEMQKIKNKEYSALDLTTIRRMLKELNSDMILSKIQLRGIRNPAKKLGDEKGVFSIDAIDYSNIAHIKAIIENIRFGELSPSNVTSHLAYDMKKAIDELYKQGKLDELDLEIIDCINSKYTQRDTAKEVGRDKKTVEQRLNKIYKRIANFYS